MLQTFKIKFAGAVGKELAWKALSVYYCNSYPLYPDLLKQCSVEMKLLRYNMPHAQVGDLFVKITKFFGVMNTLKLWRFKDKIIKIVR